MSDVVFFVNHLFLTDLDKRTHKQNKYLDVDEKTGATSNINRRTFKKLMEYFSQDNEKLVPYHIVAADVRAILNVDEGINCKLLGKRNLETCSKNTLEMYEAYDAPLEKLRETNKNDQDFLDKIPETNVPLVLKEFNLLKKVFMQNSL